jgi:AraC-like DNA-binding protein/mannose-6-phosphate isomerase-like protein (cupin superfamily)
VAADWLTRLNGEFGRLNVGGGRLDLLHWAYDPHLRDNQPHRHTYFEACLVGRYGAGTFTVLDVDHALTPGTFFIARPGVVHQIRNADSDLMELSWVGFAWTDDTAAVKTEGERLMRDFAASESCVAHDEGGQIRSVWEALRALAPNALPEQVRALIHALVLAMAKALVPSDLPPERLDPHAQIARHAVRYIEDNLNRPLTIDEIADHVHVSARHLTRLFSNFAGTSPARFIMTARLDRAMAMLERTDVPIKEIAERLGFGDAAYLTRCFTRRYGTPPATHRRERAVVRIVQAPGGLI